MIIRAENIGKKFNRHWIFRNINFEISNEDRIAITGANGAGKSTLLQILSGYLSHSEGNLYLNNQKGNHDQSLKIHYSAPYIELLEEMKLSEFLDFHSNFRKRKIENEEIATIAGLPLNQPISEFSTGTKQRVQLCTAFYFENEITFMDEPTANLDEYGYKWWAKETQSIHTPLILASNQQREINICKPSINL